MLVILFACSWLCCLSIMLVACSFVDACRLLVPLCVDAMSILRLPALAPKDCMYRCVALCRWVLHVDACIRVVHTAVVTWW